ncbi:MAG: hypothetical protein QOK37_2659 [Thermoanaerobaculia bacterium]|jgi:hypothetical protein|nr:hypothetical protein [Thermoanaerobaculia bacterium]
MQKRPYAGRFWVCRERLLTRQQTNVGGLRLGHRSLHFYSDLVVAKLERHRSQRASNTQTGNVPQILHQSSPRLEVSLVGDKLRPVETDVKQMTTRCCGRVRQKHNRERKYSLNHMFRKRSGNGISEPSPPLFHGFPAGYPQFFAQGFKCKSAENQRNFHMFCT